jgi:WhiB family redox-sensing transcriptional regulator
MELPNLSQGLCREVGVEFFFPEPGEAESTYRMARAICSGCTVKEQCREWGINHEYHGMWGGTTPMERRAIRKKNNIIVREVLITDYV